MNEIQQEPLPAYIIERFLPRAGLAIVGGPPKSNKSFLVLQTIADGLQGKPVLGDRKVEMQRVVVFNAEGGFWVIKRREPAYHDLNADQRSRVQITDAIVKVTLHGRVLNKAGIDAIVQQWAAWKPDLVVFDPLVYYHASDENDNAQMASVLEAFHLIARSLDSGVLLVHHLRKLPKSNPIDGVSEGEAVDLRGAISTFAAVDSAVILTKQSVNRRVLRFEGRYDEERRIEAVWQFPRFTFREETA